MDRALQKESSLCRLYKQVNFISDTTSPPLLVDANPTGPLLSCTWICLDVSGILKLGAIVFSHVKTLR